MVHSNRRQDGLVSPKVGVVRFSTSRKRHLKSTISQNKNLFCPGVVPTPPNPNLPSHEDRLRSPNFQVVTSLHATLPSRD